jgi:hypothetical protein
MRLLPSALLALLLAHALPTRAAESQACPPGVLSVLGRELKAAHFAPSPNAFGKDPAGVVLASSCKRMPDDPRLTLAAAAWDAHEEDAKSLVVAIVDEAASAVVALHRDRIDEDPTMRVNNGSLRLDTAPYLLAPGVRAFGLDVFGDDASCGEGGLGPRRALYVRDGRALRPVLEGLYVSQYAWLQGNQPRCSPPDDKAPAVSESYDVTIGLGEPGRGGWRDLALTVTAHRDDHKPSRLKPLHVRVPYDGRAYPLDAYDKAVGQWRK